MNKLVRYSGVPKVRKSKEPLKDELLDEKYSEINKEIEQELLQDIQDEEMKKETGEPPREEKKAWRNRIILIAIIVGLTMMLFRVISRTTGFIMFFF